jgi:hypothetical protein
VEAGQRRNWREHPLLRRLPLLVLVVLGLWLWRSTEAPERELVWHLEGPGWGEIRTLEFQLKDEDGQLVRREERFFRGPPPGSLSMKARLRPGTYQVWVFARGEEGVTRSPRLEMLTLGREEERVERGLRVPESR